MRVGSTCTVGGAQQAASVGEPGESRVCVCTAQCCGCCAVLCQHMHVTTVSAQRHCPLLLFGPSPPSSRRCHLPAHITP